MAFGFGGVALYDVVMEHLDQSIEASTNPEHRHRLRGELRTAEQHVNAVVEALRAKPDALDPKSQLDQALAQVDKPQEGRVHEWLQAVARSLHQSTNENK